MSKPKNTAKKFKPHCNESCINMQGYLCEDCEAYRMLAYFQNKLNDTSLKLAEVTATHGPQCNCADCVEIKYQEYSERMNSELYDERGIYNDPEDCE